MMKLYRNNPTKLFKAYLVLIKGKFKTLNLSRTRHNYLNHGTLIELIWTITPALILILIAFPSFKLLYLMDEVTDPSLTVFVEGHQWYWNYQSTDFSFEYCENDEELEFDSYLENLFLDKFYLKQAISEPSKDKLLTYNSKITTVFLAEISNKSDWSNINLNDNEVKTFNRFYGSIKRASTLYSKQVDRHTQFQDGDITLPISERELERRLEKSKANLLRRYDQLLNKQRSILSKNPGGTIPSPRNLYDWSHEDFDVEWSDNNNNNLNNN